MVVSIVVHYNNVSDCKRCVNSLLNIDIQNHTILIVDNCSEQKNYVELQTYFQQKNVILIRTLANGGFGYGVNRGVEYISLQAVPSEYIHIINCDARVVNNEYLGLLVNVLEQKRDIAMIGPAVYADDGITVQNTIMPFTSLSSALNFKKNYKSISKITNPIEISDVECINGVCFVIRKSVFEKVNGFCEDYFMYNEEHDLCFKIKKEGFRVVFWSGESIIHYGAEVGGGLILNWRFLFNRKNQVLFISKHRTKLEAFVLASIFAVASIPKFLNKNYRKEITWWSYIFALFNSVFNRVQIKNT